MEASTDSNEPRLPDIPMPVSAPDPLLPGVESVSEDEEFLDLAVTDTTENPPVMYLEDKAVVKVRIFEVKTMVGKNPPHRAWMNVVLEAADHPGVDVIRDMLHLPFKGSREHNAKADTELARRKKIDAIRAFYACFGIQDRTPYEKMVGLEGWVQVHVEDSPEFGIQQRVARGGYMTAPSGSGPSHA